MHSGKEHEADAGARGALAEIDVLVAIVTYNSADVVEDLLTSLPGGLADCSWRVVVADNDSQDGTVRLVLEAMPSALVVEMGRNAGYAAGINAAVAAGGPSRSVLVLNADTRLAPGAVAAMLRRLGRAGVGIVVPRLLNSVRELVPTLRREPTIPRALGDAVLTANRASRFARWGEQVTSVESYAEESTADWAAGPAMLISRECIDVCGAWDESFFLYSEETEFCLRARSRGFKLILAPDAEVMHLGGESRISPTLRALLVVNRVRLYRRTHSRPATAVFWLIAVLREASRAACGRRISRRSLAALISPRRAHETKRDAMRQLPDSDRRRALVPPMPTAKRIWD